MTEHAAKYELDLNPKTIARLLQHIQSSPLWSDLIKPIGDFVADAGDTEAKALLVALVTHAAYDFTAGRITAADDGAFADLGALLGCASAFVGREIGLQPTPVTPPTGFAPNTCERVYVQSKGPEGLVRSRLAGWRIMSDGTTVPLPAGKPPGRWFVADEPNATATWPDGRIVNLGLGDLELQEYDR
jgi:hypothetical protein